MWIPRNNLTWKFGESSRLLGMELLCAKEVACELGVSERTAQRMLQAGEIRGFRVGAKLWRVRKVDLDLYVFRRINENLTLRESST